MKRKNIFLAGAVAGIALAGLAAYFLSSDRGKNATSKLKKDGKKLFKDLETVIKDTRSKLDEVKKAMKEECVDNEMSAQKNKS